MRAGAALIHEASRQATRDLREILGVLRQHDPGTDDVVTTAGTVADLVGPLVRIERAAGQDINVSIDAPGPIPPRLAHNVRRLVQESLTNARRHAPGSRVELRVHGRVGDTLTLSTVNSAPNRCGTTGEPGYGLLGVTERVRIEGGTLDFGPTPDGGFNVEVRLPWPRPSGADQPTLSGSRSLSSLHVHG